MSEHFTAETLRWFDGLAADNSRSYFQANRDRYEADVVAPLQAMLSRLAREFGGTPRLFRPNRDVRFSADKSPYKTNASGVLPEPDRTGDFYIQVSPDGFVAAAGLYVMSPAQLERYRTALSFGEDVDEAAWCLDVALGRLRTAGYEVKGELLKTVPRGIPRDAPHANRLRYKSLYACLEVPRDTLLEATCVEETGRLWRTAEPLLTWLRCFASPP